MFCPVQMIELKQWCAVRGCVGGLCKLSVYKPGGTVGASDATMLDCIEMTRLRYKEVSNILRNALSTHPAT